MPDVTLAPSPVCLAPDAPAPCPHAHLTRQGAQVRCDDCGATAAVPRCLGCREKKCQGCESLSCPTCQGKVTTWIVRPPHLVCYKCDGTVPGLAVSSVMASSREE